MLGRRPHHRSPASDAARPSRPRAAVRAPGARRATAPTTPDTPTRGPWSPPPSRPASHAPAPPHSSRTRAPKPEPEPGPAPAPQPALQPLPPENRATAFETSRPTHPSRTIEQNPPIASGSNGQTNRPRSHLGIPNAPERSAHLPPCPEPCVRPVVEPPHLVPLRPVSEPCNPFRCGALMLSPEHGSRLPDPEENHAARTGSFSYSVLNDHGSILHAERQSRPRDPHPGAARLLQNRSAAQSLNGRTFQRSRTEPRMLPPPAGLSPARSTAHRWPGSHLTPNSRWRHPLYRWPNCR